MLTDQDAEPEHYCTVLDAMGTFAEDPANTAQLVSLQAVDAIVPLVSLFHVRCLF